MSTQDRLLSVDQRFVEIEMDGGLPLVVTGSQSLLVASLMDRNAWELVWTRRFVLMSWNEWKLVWTVEWISSVLFRDPWILPLEDVFITGSSSIVFEEANRAYRIPLSDIPLRLIRPWLHTDESKSISSSYLTIICLHYQFTISTDLPPSTNWMLIIANYVSAYVNKVALTEHVYYPVFI